MDGSTYVEDGLATFLDTLLGLFTIIICFAADVPPPHSIVFLTFFVIAQIIFIIELFIVLYVYVLPIYKDVFGRFGFTAYLFVATAAALSLSDCYSDLCRRPSPPDILAQTLCHVFFGSAPCPLMS